MSPKWKAALRVAALIGVGAAGAYGGPAAGELARQLVSIFLG